MKEIGRLYVVSPEPDEGVVEKIIEAARCGADIVQIRGKNVNKAKLTELILYIKERIPENVVLIVNDFPDVAINAGADGIHGGQSDFGLEDIKIFKEKYNLIVGISVYDSIKRAQLAEKYGADYVAFSSPFPSPSKKKVITPLEVIEKASGILKIPVFVIGGINDENAQILLKRGVYGIASLSYVFSGNTCEKVRRLKNILKCYVP